MRLRALVFDDDPAIRKLLWMVLDHRGYQVFTFPDPGLCPLYRAHHCTCPTAGACADMIVSDLEMPTVKGLDFVEALRAKGCHCAAIALMSGNWSEEDKQRARIIGCKLFTKPFAMGEFTQWVDETTHGVKPDRELADWHTVNTEPQP
jgi:DNA-binding response OmpR family regulator